LRALRLSTIPGNLPPCRRQSPTLLVLEKKKTEQTQECMAPTHNAHARELRNRQALPNSVNRTAPHSRSSGLHLSNQEWDGDWPWRMLLNSDTTIRTIRYFDLKNQRNMVGTCPHCPWKGSTKQPIVCLPIRPPCCL